MRERIGPYRIERILGEGAMGIVYLGRHEVLERNAAIKTVLPRLADDAQLRKRLLSEAKAQARLLHPNVVTVYEPVDDHGDLFIAMEYVDGETLANRLERAPEGRLSLHAALPLFVQLLDALHFVHGEKIVHRDVKPSNVMVSHSGRVKLADFGLALLTGEPRLTASRRIAGTPHYMSPEQLQAKDLDHRTDIYSAALVLYRMLSGRAPFESKEYLAQLHERMIGPRPLKRFAPDVPASVCEALAIALQMEPADRYSSAAAFRDELSRAAVGFFPSPPDREETLPAGGGPLVDPPLLPEPDPNTMARGVAWTVIAGSLMAATSLVVPRVQTSKPLSTPTVTEPAPAQPIVQEAAQAAVLKPGRDVRPVPPPKDPPPFTPTTKPDDSLRQALRRSDELDSLREEIRKGLATATTHLQNEKFTEALGQLEDLDRSARREPVELKSELDDIAALRARVNDARVTAAAKEHQEQLWLARVDDIEKAIREGHFPEAIDVAKRVKSDPHAPPATAARADELLREANEQLIDLFQSGTQVGTTTNVIRKPSSPPRKND